MNIQAIRLFLHVTQLGSLAAGAQQLNMSPSAASRLLAGLERTTGLKLFSRDGHALRPTVEGAQYFNECRRVLIAVDELPRALDPAMFDAIVGGLEAVGYRQVVVDPRGYRQGSLNDGVQLRPI